MTLPPSSPRSQTLVLASSSPRRRELLTQIGVPFEVVVQPVDETRHPGESPTDYVCRLARAKAAVVNVRERQAQARPVLGADTIVVVDDLVLGKPEHKADAARMLALLSGRRHQVMSAVCVMQGEHSQLRLSSSWVGFGHCPRPISTPTGPAGSLRARPVPTLCKGWGRFYQLPGRQLQWCCRFAAV